MNGWYPTVGGVVGLQYTLKSLLDKLNAEAPIDVTEAGIVMLTIASQDWNAASAIVVRASGRTTFVNFLQPPKAPEPIVTRFSLNFTVVKLIH